MQERDLFISHSSGDAEAARDLRAGLEAAGYSCWMAPDDVTGSDPWAEQILTAIQNSRAMLILISANANRSPHVSREVNLAIGRGRPVLPIRIENIAPEASLEYLLSLMQRVDAFPLPIAPHLARILRRLATVVPLATTTVLPLATTAATAPVARSVPEASPAQPPSPGSDVTDAEPATELAARTAPIGPGSRVGAFTVDAVLGEGGMATVYRATQDEPYRSVALKLIRADHVADATYRQRFLAEKDTLAALEHPSIVPIYAAGEADGRLYIAMRLVDGPDLATRLKEAGRLTLAETIATLRPIADAIDHAHEAGVVHRDLKPSNIILDRRGRAYLTDFGLGKHVDRPRDISVSGITVGTLDYMAPEQFSGPLDGALAGRIDIYALGCVAYACLTGAPPFRALEPERVMYGHLHGPVPSILDVHPQLPSAVDAAIQRALAKNPADRFPTGGEFLTALAAPPVIDAAAPAALVTPKAGPALPQSVGVAAAPPSAAHAVMADQPPGLPLPAPPAATVLAPRPGPGSLLARMRRSPALLAGGATGAALVVVATLVFASGAKPAPTSGPGGTQAAAAAGSSRTPALTGPAGTSAAPETIGPLNSRGVPTSDPTSAATLPPLPTVPPAPTPTPDNKAPTGISVAIKGSSVTTTKKVDLTLKATGATEMRLGTATSATGTCAMGAWTKFGGSVNDFDLKGGTAAGTRWVCVEFRDAAKNPAGPARDSVYYDHAPTVTNGLYFSYSTSDLAGQDHFTTRFFNAADSLHVAEDADGLATLKVTKLWLINSNGSTVDYSGNLSTDGKTAQFDIPTNYCGGYNKFKYGFTASDSHVTRDGYFYVEVCTA